MSFCLCFDNTFIPVSYSIVQAQPLLDVDPFRFLETLFCLVLFLTLRFLDRFLDFDFLLFFLLFFFLVGLIRVNVGTPTCCVSDCVSSVLLYIDAFPRLMSIPWEITSKQGINKWRHGHEVLFSYLESLPKYGKWIVLFPHSNGDFIIKH